MLRIEIAYQPYQMKLTTLKIDGIDIIENASGYEKINHYAKQQIPLQSWIDPIPYAKWDGLLREAIGNSRETEVECIFTGRQMDLDDLKESFNGVEGVTVSYPKENIVFDDHSTKKAIKEAYKLITGDDFRKIVEDPLLSKDNTNLQAEYNNLPERYAETLDGTFRIVFAGLYSSGKSTVINALIGKDLLPTSDRTCTSKVFRIKNDPNVKYARMLCRDSEDKIVVAESDYTEETLKSRFTQMFPRSENNNLLPSDPPDIETVEIYTDLSRLYPSGYGNDDLHLEIIDTPGVDSGVGNREHHDKITESVIHSHKKEMVIFCIKATTPEQGVIQDFLEMADEHSYPGEYDQRFLFVLNRADECKFRAGESWEQELNGLKNFYTKRNDNVSRDMCNLRFFPTSALGALCVRTGRVEGNDYERCLANYYSRSNKPMAEKVNYHFDEQCSTSQRIKSAIKNRLSENAKSSCEVFQKQAVEIELHSGIVSLEMAIQDYIAKYAFPLKMQELLSTFSTIFKETKQLSKFIENEFNRAKKRNEEEGNREKEETDCKRKEAEKKKILDEASNEIEKQKSLLVEIKKGFDKRSETAVVDLETKMHLTLEELFSEIQNNNRGSTERLKAIIDDTQRECEDAINESLKESRKYVSRIEYEVNSLFRRIAEIYDSGAGFHIEQTTGFKRIKTDGVSAAQGTTIKNPKYRYCYGFLAGFRERILNIGRSKTIFDRSVIDIKELKNQFTLIKSDFDVSVDEAFKSTQKSLDDAVTALECELNNLKEFIKSYEEKLQGISNHLKKICADHESAKKLEETLEENRKVLEKIMGALHSVPTIMTE